jgi:GrpB-like predicted nucleotidyltransferase (UPF0157 family)
LIGRVEHFGSTAVPGLCEKPIVDMLVEGWDLEVIRQTARSILTPPTAGAGSAGGATVRSPSC